MDSLVEVMEKFESSLSDSIQDSIGDLKRQFALAQTRSGHEVALSALVMVYIIAEQRRRHAELLAKPLCN